MSEPGNSAPRHHYEEFLRKLPADWRKQEITQLGAVVGGGTPSRDVPSFWRGSLPWVTPGEVSGEASKLLHDTQDHISPSGLAESGANLLPAGSLLVTTRATLGARVINAVPMATNQGFKSIVFKKPEEASYYYHVFEKVKPELVRRASGTTFLEISGAEFGSIKLPSPSPEEKKKIAQLLDLLDTAIHQTAAIVEKLKQVKQGLLHDLLTRGVDGKGELRPSHENAPHLYQDSKLGWIPRDWTLGSISANCSEVVDCPHSTPVFTDVGVLVARTMHIKDGVFLEGQASRVSEKQYRERVARLTPEPGDVIFTREAPVGEAFVIPADMKICLGQRVMLLRPRLNVLSAHFLLAQIYSGVVHERIGTLTSGTTNPHLNVAEVRDFMIPLPPYVEQIRIGERISAVSDRLSKEVRELSKLKLQKIGLMDDLLTGRVRVTPLLAKD